MIVIEKVDFKNGIVTFDDFIRIDDQKPLEQQSDNLKEDLLQVTYGEHLILDVGWYSRAGSNGQFVVYLIHNFDWEYPLYQRSTKSLKRMYKMLQLIIDNIVPNHQC